MLNYAHQPHAPSYYAATAMPWEPGAALQGWVDCDVCVIGGGEVYALTLGRADVLYLTEVDTVVEDAHAFFPAFDPTEWREVAREPHPVDAKHALAFDFVEYHRR